MNPLGQALQAYRKLKQISTDELAERAGIEVCELRHLETSDSYSVDMPIVSALIDCLGANKEEFTRAVLVRDEARKQRRTIQFYRKVKPNARRF